MRYAFLHLLIRYILFYRAPIQLGPSGHFAIISVGPVKILTVFFHQFFGAERARFNSMPERDVLFWFRRCITAVHSANHNPANGLFKFPYIPWPRIILPHILLQLSNNRKFKIWPTNTLKQMICQQVKFSWSFADALA